MLSRLGLVRMTTPDNCHAPLMTIVYSEIRNDALRNMQENIDSGLATSFGSDGSSCLA